MHSKTTLFKHLATLGLPAFADAPEKGLKHTKISDETYGKESYIYVKFDGVNERMVAEDKLEALGHKVNKKYAPGSGLAEIRVSYFKGTNWNV